MVRYGCHAFVRVALCFWPQAPAKFQTNLPSGNQTIAGLSVNVWDEGQETRTASYTRKRMRNAPSTKLHVTCQINRWYKG